MAADLVIADSDAFHPSLLSYRNFLRWLLNFSPSQGSRGKKAMEIALLGDRYTAEQAEAMGMINFVTTPGELEEETKS